MKNILGVLLVAIFMLSVVSAYTEFNHDVPLFGQATQTAGFGMRFEVNGADITINSTTKNSTAESEYAQLYFGNGTLIENVSFVGDVATFTTNWVLRAGDLYRIESSGGSGGAGTRVFNNTESFPVSETLFNWTGGSTEAANDTSWNNLLGISVELRTAFTTLSVPLNNTNVTLPINFTSVLSPFGTNTTLNGTLNIWHTNGTVLQFTDTTPSGDTTYFNISALTPGDNYLWNVYMCQDDDSCVFSDTNFTFSLKNFVTNSFTFSATTFETKTETFYTNITTNGTAPTNAFLVYNSTPHSATITNTDGDNYNLSTSIQIPLTASPNTFFFNFTIGSTVQNTTTQTQTVGNTEFGLCNATLTNEYLNFTFQDENNQSALIAEIPSSSFVYYLGDGTINKTFTYINGTGSLDYKFCASPTNETFNIDYSISYKNDTGYPQRTFESGGALEFTNVSTPKILYLLHSGAASTINIQVIDVAGLALPNVFVNVSREVAGVPTVVAQGTTDAGGSLPLKLDTNFLHTFILSRSDLPTLTKSITPSTEGHTFTMGSSNIVPADYSKGIVSFIGPVNITLLNDTTYSFNYTLNSSFWTVTEFGFILKNSTGTELGSQSAPTNGGSLALDFDTGNQTEIMMHYYFFTNGTFVNGTRTWSVLNSEGTSWSLRNFFDDLKTYTSDGIFGLTSWATGMIAFLLIFIFAGILSYNYGLNSPGMVSGSIFALTLFLDYLGIFNAMTEAAGVSYIITIIVGLLITSFWVKEGLQ